MIALFVFLTPDWLRRAVWSGPGGSSAAAEATAQSSTLCRLGAGTPPAPTPFPPLSQTPRYQFLPSGWAGSSSNKWGHMQFCAPIRILQHLNEKRTASPETFSQFSSTFCQSYSSQSMSGFSRWHGSQVNKSNRIELCLIRLLHVHLQSMQKCCWWVSASSTTQAAPRLQMFLNEKKTLLSRFKGVCGRF